MQNKWWLTDVDRTHSKRASRIRFLPAASGSLSLRLSHSLGLSIGVRVNIMHVSASLGDIPMPVGGQAKMSALSRKAFGRSIIAIRTKAAIEVAEASG